MSATPGLVDIHVLEETASRVHTLTSSISAQADSVGESSRTSQRALGPKPSQSRNLGNYTSNVNAVLDLYGEIERDVGRLAQAQKHIETGPAKIGLQQYIEVVSNADKLAAEFSNSRTYINYPVVIERARQIRQRGIDRLQRLVVRVATTVYVPVDGLDYLGSSEPLPPIAPEDLDTLSQLLTVLNQYPETRDRTDDQLVEVLGSYMAKSLAGPRQKLSSGSANGTNIKAFGLLCEDLKTNLNTSVRILFSQDASRLTKLTAALTQMSQAQMSGFTNSIADDASHGGVGGPTIKEPEPKANRDPTQRSPKRASQPSDEARTGPRSLPKIVTDAQKGGTKSTASPGPSIGASSGGSSSAAAAGANAGGLSSPGGMGSPSTSAQIAGFTLFDIIESARVTPIAPEDLAKYKRDGLTTLKQVFVDIEARSRKSPITSEFAVSPASIQFMQTLKSLSSVGHGVEIVLSEVPTRAYLAQPLPQWAAKSEPTPDGRANPLSQYYADCIECLYATLHQLAAETFKNQTKTGVFVLCNLAAVEHYITDSNTETFASIARKSTLMLALGPVAIQRFQKLMDNAFKEYLTEWRSLAPYLMETTLTSSAGNAGGKLTGKGREAVKEKFRQFNSEFETLVDRQKRYQVTDPMLRARMSAEIRALIGPLYYRFYDKHIGGDFTKNLDKYIKWNKEQFNQAIEF